MKVKLIDHTNNPDKIAALAAWTCHRETIPDIEEISKAQAREILTKALSAGHEGVIEHVNFTFGVENVSRTLTHQLVRHRIATYDQQSQREVDMENTGFIKPDAVLNNTKYKSKFNDLLSKALKLYDDMAEEDIPMEDARYILPNATETNIVITMNARTLKHFFRLRGCRRAQWEIRELVWRMLAICKEKAPIIFENAGPPCINGSCPESDFACGDPFTKEDVKEKMEKYH